MRSTYAELLPDNRFIAQSPFQSQSYVSQQAFTQPASFATQAQYAPQQTAFVQQQLIGGRGSPYGTQTGLSSGSSYNLQEPCNRLGVRPPLQYPLQPASPQQHPLAAPGAAQAGQTQVDPNSGGAFFVTVLDFPDAEATPEALYYQPEDIDTELGNRHPPLVLTASRTKDHDDPDIDPRVAAAAVSPAGIVQSTQPIPNVSVFVNSKESPLLQSLRDEAERNRQRLRNRNRQRLLAGGALANLAAGPAGANFATGVIESDVIPGDQRYVDDVRDSISVVAGPEPREST